MYIRIYVCKSGEKKDRKLENKTKSNTIELKTEKTKHFRGFCTRTISKVTSLEYFFLILHCNFSYIFLRCIAFSHSHVYINIYI